MADEVTAAHKPLPVAALRWRCETAQFGPGIGESADQSNGIIGQERALDALRFGIEMSHDGYNVFVLGPAGLGKHTTVKTFLEEKVKDTPPPPDWCYVSNFEDSRKPNVIRLGAGRGCKFKRDMDRFVEEVRDQLTRSFDSDEFRTRRQVIEEKFNERNEEALNAVAEEAQKDGLMLLRTPVGFSFAPTSDGKIVPPEVFNQFPEKERKRIEGRIRELQTKLQEALKQVPGWVAEMRDEMRDLNKDVAEFAMDHLLGRLLEEYADCENVLAYLKEVRNDVIDNVETIVGSDDSGSALNDPAMPDIQPHIVWRYRVNLLIDNERTEHAPVVFEDEPSLDRLIGRIEHRAAMGTLLTDFHLIRPGALHAANNGYLILDAHKVLTKPMAWEGLKRALMAKKIRIEPLAQALGLLSTVSLEPEPIPLDLKIVMVGDRELYYLLSALDPECNRLFRVAADFDDRVERTPENAQKFADLARTIAEREKLRSLNKSGIARVLEFCARIADDSERFSSKIEELSELLLEADHWAAQAGRKTIGDVDIREAEDARERRKSRVRDRVHEQITRETVSIGTSGRKTGQINGLSVLQVGDYRFGQPSRITARIWLGKGDVVDIEREAKLGGPLHSKGVLILSGYLNGHYAMRQPLSLGASLVFEQSYGGVDGDSASSAELYALLSEIAEVPTDQQFAVTGSVNQKGEVQAIGGVNEKIEGFFDICQERGLTGGQGVLIPASNVKHLMLADRVVDAVKDGKFNVYPVETIDQGIEILTGMPAGVAGEDGTFPEGTFNHRVAGHLARFAEMRRAFGEKSDGKDAS